MDQVGMGAIGSVTLNLMETEGVMEMGCVVLLHPQELYPFLTERMTDPFSGLCERGLSRPHPLPGVCERNDKLKVLSII